MVASAASLIVKFDLYNEWHDWARLSDNGMIRNHDAKGDTLYGIEIMVHPDFRGMRLARRLIRGAQAPVPRKEPEPHGHRRPHSRLSEVCQTAERRRPTWRECRVKKLIDPVLTTQLSNGFELVRVMRDYMPSDEDSARLGDAHGMDQPRLRRPTPGARVAPVQLVRVAAVQYQMRRISSFDDFAQQVEFFVDAASDYHCDFVLFPELFTLQLLSLTPRQAARAWQRASWRASRPSTCTS